MPSSHAATDLDLVIVRRDCRRVSHSHCREPSPGVPLLAVGCCLRWRPSRRRRPGVSESSQSERLARRRRASTRSRRRQIGPSAARTFCWACSRRWASCPIVRTCRPLDVQITRRFEGPDFTRYTLSFAADQGDRVPCYLFIPDGPAMANACRASWPCTRRRPPARDSRPGWPTARTCTTALELARRGYVVLVPDYPSFGDYKYDFNADTYTSGSMKGIFNHMRCGRSAGQPRGGRPEADRRDRPFAGRAQRDVRRRVRRADQSRSSPAAAGRRFTTTTAASSTAGPATATCRDSRRLPARSRPGAVRHVRDRGRRSRRGRSSRSRRCTTATSTSTACARRSPRPSRSTTCWACREAASSLSRRGHDFPPKERHEAYQFIDRILEHTPPRDLESRTAAHRAARAGRRAGDVQGACRASASSRSRPSRWWPAPWPWRFDERRPAVRRRDARLLGARQGTARPRAAAGRHRRRRPVRQAPRLRRGLSWPTAVACYDGGVFVGAAPDIYYLKDTDGDGKADEQAGLHRLFARQRAGTAQQLSVGARQSHSRLDQHQRRTDHAAGRRRTSKPVLARRPRFLLRPAHARPARRKRRRPARHELRRLGAQVRLLQQRSHSDGDVRGPLPGPQSERVAPAARA